MNLTGECLCGMVKYKFDGEFNRTRSCHCSRCRKAFGGGGSATGFINPQDFSWISGEDNLSEYKPVPDFGVYFCKSCGSKICASFQGNIIGIVLGTLNEDPNMKLMEHIYVGSKASWDDIGSDVPQYEEGPPDQQ